MTKLSPVAVLLATSFALIGLILADAPIVIACMATPALAVVLASARRRCTLRRRLLVSLPLIGVAALLRWFGDAPARDSLLTALRVSSAVAWSSCLSSALTPEEIRAALRALGAPAALVELIAHTRRFAVQLAATASEAWTAATLRAGLFSLRATAGTGGHVAGVIVVRAFDRAESVAIANALRGRHLVDDAPPEVSRSSGVRLSP